MSIQRCAYSCVYDIFSDFAGVIRIEPVDVALKLRGYGLELQCSIEFGILRMLTEVRRLSVGQ
jgi:hypothetical protein